MFQHHNQFVSAAVGLVARAATQLSEVRYGTQPKERRFFCSPRPLRLPHDSSDPALPGAQAPLSAIRNRPTSTSLELLFYNSRKKGRFFQ